MKQKLQNEDIQIREMSPKDIPAMLNMVKAVGWNQTEKDLKIFLEDKSNVNYAAEIGGRLVGTVASANYDRKIAWISMMIVQEAYRGRGIGKILMQTIIRRLKLDGADSIKLDATPAGKLVYSKLGFKEEYAIYRLVHPSPDNLSLSIAAQISFLDSQNLEGGKRAGWSRFWRRAQAVDSSSDRKLSSSIFGNKQARSDRSFGARTGRFAL